MCGIFGIINHDGPLPEQAASAFIQSMRHRGPDDQGCLREDGLLLGMVRLSIIDLATGHQPISNREKTLHICFNGEIYNYLPLRKALEAKGHHFATNTDTEVILRAYMEYGRQCLDMLNGMFAFAIWDSRRRECFLARDRLGIKPLYYLCRGNSLYFASELKSLIAAAGDPGPVDRLALSRYFSFGYVPSPQSPFSQIQKLPAGHYLTFGSRGINLGCYWNPQVGPSQGAPTLPLSQEIGHVAHALEQAVAMEMMSDVPLGCLLSGGVDSSAVVALAQRRSSAPLHTFCYRFAEPTHDESADAQVVADHLGTIHHVVDLGQSDATDALVNICHSLDEPFADSTYLTLSLLSREVARHVKVVLTGMGGDEVFSGYPTLRAHRYMHWFKRLPVWLRQDLATRWANALPVSDKYFSFEFKLKRFLRGQQFSPETQHFIWMENFSWREKQALLGDFMPENSLEETYAVLGQELARCQSGEPLDRILYLDLKFFLENNGLFQVDRASMAHSLEARVPLLNQLVLDRLLGVPWRHKYFRGQTKYLLRQVAKPLLPPTVFTKPKKGFGPPVSAWLRTVFREVLLETLHPRRLKAGPLHPQPVTRMIKEHLDRRADHGRSLWALLIFQLWWDRYA